MPIDHTSLADRLFGGADLTGPFFVLSVTGALMAIYVMQQSWHDASSQTDPVWMQWARRISSMLVAMSLMWSLSYLDNKQWQPWPTEFLLVVALNLHYFVRSLLLFTHRKDRVIQNGRTITRISLG